MSLHKPVIFSCPVNGNASGRFMAYMPTKMTTKDLDLVDKFLAWAGNNEWRIEKLSKRERMDRNVPLGSRIVSFPVHQKDWFYQRFEEYITPVRDFMSRNGYTQLPAPALLPQQL